MECSVFRRYALAIDNHALPKKSSNNETSKKKPIKIHNQDLI